jgi:hypothetical protein
MQLEGMTYDVILKWMQDYFRDFNAYGQNPDTIHRMDAYFAPDFEFLPYIAFIEPVKGRDAWYEVLLSHPSGIEVFDPEDIIIDDRRKVVVVKIKTDVKDSETGEVLVTKRYFARYPLVLDENGDIRIKNLEFFWEILPEGAMEIDDVFDRDRKKNK